MSKEPGAVLITGCSSGIGRETARHLRAGGWAEAADADDPYARFNAAVGAATQGANEGAPLARVGGGPETVARAIERAITARRPRTRYGVTASARLAIAQRKLVTQFPSPGRG